MSTITPQTSSGESASAYRQRTRQVRYVEEVQRRARRRRVLGFVAAAVVVVGLAVGAGILAFRGTLGSEMALRDSDAQDVLVAAAEGEATYVLVEAELGSIAAPLDRSGPDVLLLMRLDAQARSCAIVNVPPDLRVTLSDNEVHRIGEAALEGDAALVRAVSAFAGVPVSHIVKIDAQGIVGLASALGGVSVDVDQVIDDPHAGDVCIAAGEQVLEGDAILTYLRATNVKQGVLDQMNHQLQYAAATVHALFAGDGNGGFSSRLDAAAPFFQTDCSYKELVALADWLGTLERSQIKLVTLPGYTTAITGLLDTEVQYYIASSQDMASIIESLDPNAQSGVSSGSAAGLDLAAFTVDVQNGTSIVGAAAATADKLSAAGFTVGEVGNAEQPVFAETLVIYKDDLGEKRAQAVVQALGIGRAVYASYYYEFDADVLVITGADYMPTT